MTETGSISTQRRAAAGWWIVAGSLALILIICVGIIWAGAQNDADGNPLVENPGAVLVGLFSALGVIGSAAIAKLTPVLAAIKENVQNDHKKPDGSPLYLRDDLDEKHGAVEARFSGIEDRFSHLEDRIETFAGAVEHALRANRKTSDDVTQLREDVQAGRSETGEVRSDVRGLRKDLGWIRDYITKGTTS